MKIINLDKLNLFQLLKRIKYLTIPWLSQFFFISLHRTNKLKMKDRIMNEKELERLGSFLDIIVRRLEEINLNVMQIKDFIEQDTYAKENAEKLKPFIEDINKLSNVVEHIYDNMPTE